MSKRLLSPDIRLDLALSQKCIQSSKTMQDRGALKESLDYSRAIVFNTYEFASKPIQLDLRHTLQTLTELVSHRKGIKSYLRAS